VSAIEHVVIAAAGLGSRLGHGLPKCLVEIEGKTLLERQLALFRHVPDVRIVVGYMEHAVMEALSRLDRRVIVVRNPDFRNTTTQDSYALGATGISGRCVFLDADIVFDPGSLAAFFEQAAQYDLTIGVTQTKTDDAVFAEVGVQADDQLELRSFSRERRSEYEWANIVCAPASTFHRGRGAVFETLAELLPARAVPVVSYEVDTESDLQRARSYLRAAGH
jgi:NDP-sugar pyrophosphorylase family protein